MQFVELDLLGMRKWCLVLGKWEATAFVVVGKNKKAPDDEQAVRFGCYEGRPVVWISDGTQMLYVEPQEGAAPEGVHEVCTPALSLKACATKCRVNQMLVFPLGERKVYLGKLRELSRGDTLEELEEVGELDPSPPLSWGRGQFDAVSALVAKTMAAPSGQGQWQTAARFAATLGAVAKAAGDAATVWVHPPRDGAAPLVVRVDGTHGSGWCVALMPSNAP